MKLILLTCLLFYSSFIYSQISKIARIHKKTQTITVIDSAKGFYSETSIEFSTNPERNLVEIDYNGLYPIDDLKLFRVNKKKILPDFNYLISDLDIENEFFYLDSKYKLIECEPNMKYVCKYKQHSDELMYLCDIQLNQAYEVDTFEYFIKIPPGYQMIFNKVNTELLKYLSIDSSKSENNFLVYRIVAQPAEPLNPYTAFKQNYSLIRNPELRILVTPESYKNNENAYFRKWYNELLKPVSILSPVSKKLADSLTNNLSDKDSIIDRFYSFVQRSIRYVGLYKGIGAFQPHDVNSVISSQKGDCKDVANLLCQLLKYKGINASLALTNIGNTANIFDFPSLASANHVVCAVIKDTSWLFLDATDDFNKMGAPLLSLQGRNLFIITENGYQYFKYPVLNCEKNNKSMLYNLKYDNNKFLGDFEIKYIGLSAYFIKYLKNTFSGKDFGYLLKSDLEIASAAIDYNNIALKESENSIKLTGNSELEGNILNQVGDKKYLLLSFLPFPIPQLVYRSSISDELFLENTINNTVEVTIDLQIPVNEVIFKPIDFSAPNILFKMNAFKTDKTKLKIYYEFSINEVIINKSNIYEINKMLSLYNSQKAIIIK
ncbi:MAG: transglutaminase-like domain-containing protein [Bacteroidales bacterium]